MMKKSSVASQPLLAARHGLSRTADARARAATQRRAPHDGRHATAAERPREHHRRRARRSDEALQLARQLFDYSSKDELRRQVRRRPDGRPRRTGVTTTSGEPRGGADVGAVHLHAAELRHPAAHPRQVRRARSRASSPRSATIRSRPRSTRRPSCASKPQKSSPSTRRASRMSTPRSRSSSTAFAPTPRPTRSASSRPPRRRPRR